MLPPIKGVPLYWLLAMLQPRFVGVVISQGPLGVAQVAPAWALSGLDADFDLLGSSLQPARGTTENSDYASYVSLTSTIFSGHCQIIHVPSII